MRSWPPSTLGLWLALGTSGCSIASVYGPATATAPAVAVSCTDERYAPAIDVGLGGSGLGTAIFADRTDARVAAGVAALGFGASAIYGYLTTKECRQAKDYASRYHTKLLLRQIDLLNEIASAGDDDDVPSVKAPPAEPPPPLAPPLREEPPPPAAPLQ